MKRSPLKFHKFLADNKERVDKMLGDWFSRSDEIPPTLRKAMEYSLEAGGKRIRPILAIASCEAVGGDAALALSLGCALECIHTFSLIHDDLPSMDNDDLRRGKPTNHKVFGEGMAVLAGDGLFAEAFYFLSKSLRGKISSEILLDVFEEILWATGGRGMVGGQALDLDGEGKALSEKDLEAIHLHKTGRLIQASIVGGARVAGAGVKELRALQSYSEKIGLAFQIADDVLNVEGSPDRQGKSVGSDQSNQKATYPKILGLEASKKKARHLVDSAVKDLLMFDERAWALREIAKYIVERQS